MIFAELKIIQSVIKLVKLHNVSFYTILLLSLLSLSLTAQAQQFDQNYLKWKANQQEQDARLNKQSSKQNENYYLSRPSVTSPNKTQTNKTQTNKLAGAAITNKVSINAASIEQLQQLNGAGPKKAQAIIDYRNQNGQFKTIEDLQKVKGIGVKFIEKNRSMLSL
ncbi:ComEA family DNA-binding protein [Acinetobacter sp. P8-3-8]|uniref:ComEA family DNA-binding protein n=1 Tax=Acinetobacter sp. P8-3-8 TaxID=1029823 RepID=UPI000248652D|nr:ComEA family DNA-binding protein [Acinetobacter sp. P8-3-8]